MNWAGKALDWTETVRQPGAPDKCAFSLGEKLVVVTLATYANGEPYAWPTNSTLAERMGCSKSVVYRALEIAQKAGGIRRVKNPKTGRGKAWELVFSDDPEPVCVRDSSRSQPAKSSLIGEKQEAYFPPSGKTDSPIGEKSSPSGEKSSPIGESSPLIGSEVKGSTIEVPADRAREKAPRSEQADFADEQEAMSQREEFRESRRAAIEKAKETRARNAEARAAESSLTEEQAGVLDALCTDLQRRFPLNRKGPMRGEAKKALWGEFRSSVEEEAMARGVEVEALAECIPWALSELQQSREWQGKYHIGFARFIQEGVWKGPLPDDLAKIHEPTVRDEDIAPGRVITDPDEKRRILEQCL
jgi:hypothetical protein